MLAGICTCLSALWPCLHLPCCHLTGLIVDFQTCQLPTPGPLHVPFPLPALLLPPLANCCPSFRSQVKYYHPPTPSTKIKSPGSTFFSHTAALSAWDCCLRFLLPAYGVSHPVTTVGIRSLVSVCPPVSPLPSAVPLGCGGSGHGTEGLKGQGVVATFQVR